MSQLLSKDFGIVLTEGEKVIFEAQPNDRFVFYFLCHSMLSVVGILVGPLVWLGASIAKSKYRYWLTNRRAILASGFTPSAAFRLRGFQMWGLAIRLPKCWRM